MFKIYYEDNTVEYVSGNTCAELIQYLSELNLICANRMNSIYKIERLNEV